MNIPFYADFERFNESNKSMEQGVSCHSIHVMVARMNKNNK